MGQSGAAPKPPSVITIGTLYSGRGTFAVSSQGQYHGLRYWAKAVNTNDGVMVEAFHKKIPFKIVSYTDRSSTSTAATLYNQLITQADQMACRPAACGGQKVKSRQPCKNLIQST